jgi:hypothetical protein
MDGNYSTEKSAAVQYYWQWNWHGAAERGVLLHFCRMDILSDVRLDITGVVIERGEQTTSHSREKVNSGPTKCCNVP